MYHLLGRGNQAPPELHREGEVLLGHFLLHDDGRRECVERDGLGGTG